MNNFYYTFPAVKGLQANEDYYICMVPIGLLLKLFPIDSDYIEPEYRAQRKLNLSRIPEIKNYILSNRDSYVFSALCASFDGEHFFNPIGDSQNIGDLRVSMEANFLINDGQHRRAALEEALLDDPTLAEETIPVVLFLDKGLSRSQQMFTDLNKYAVKPSKSQSTFYDHKNPLSLLTKKVIQNNDFFRDYTDVENDTLGKFSAKLFTLNSIYKANELIVGHHEIDTNLTNFCIKFWLCVSTNIIEWQELRCKLITKQSLREDFIVTQNIVLYAFGRLGEFFFNNPQFDIDLYLHNLSHINWMRINPEWEGTTIVNGKISVKTANVNRTYLKIKELIFSEQKVKDDGHF